MMDRILIGLDDNVTVQAATVRLVEIGAARVEPIEGIPGALLAHVDQGNADEFIRRASALPGIRHVERDQLRSSY